MALGVYSRGKKEKPISELEKALRQIKNENEISNKNLFKRK